MTSHLATTFLLVLGASMSLAPVSVSAGIFGDGDPANGIEDDRRTISQGQGERPGDEWYRSGGTIFCDGAVRGSATLIDVSSLGGGRSGVLIATAAHVFYDLERNKRWRRCSFHYLGMNALPGYEAPIDSARLLLGKFDPAADPTATGHGAGDWAFAWLGPEWRIPGSPAGMLVIEASDVVDENTVAEHDIGLVAWNRSAGEISVVSGCRVTMSGPDDIGGGAWTGQLLDDCDSGDGASGGGLVVQIGGQPALLAIRGGEHWDSKDWPASQFPDGPPAGARWNLQSYTNYARAFDSDLLGQLLDWAESLERDTAEINGRLSGGR